MLAVTPEMIEDRGGSLANVTAPYGVNRQLS